MSDNVPPVPEDDEVAVSFVIPESVADAILPTIKGTKLEDLNDFYAVAGSFLLYHLQGARDGKRPALFDDINGIIEVIGGFEALNEIVEKAQKNNATPYEKALQQQQQRLQLAHSNT